MKFNHIIAMVMACMSTVLSSCEKDNEAITVTTGELPNLTTTVDSLVLLQENAADTAITFNWSPLEVNWSNDGVSTPILRYSLQISSKEQNFQGGSLLVLDAAGISASVTVNALNTALLEAKAAPEAPIRLLARLAMTLAPNKVVYSNVIELQVTPYEDVVMLPSLFIAGALNNWSHSGDFRVGSINGDSQYEGYANFTAGNLAFKFSSQANWNGTNYGAGAAAGKMSSAGDAGNLEVVGAGYYLLKANTETLDWSATPVSWGIIGAAAGGWGDNDDVALVYDAATGLWTATLNMTADEFKFRANKAYTINLGAGARNGILSNGGGNLRIAESGRYLVTLDLRNAGHYTYTIEAQ
jgi:starch-binding outer membrane protein SusE/F